MHRFQLTNNILCTQGVSLSCSTRSSQAPAPPLHCLILTYLWHGIGVRSCDGAIYGSIGDSHDMNSIYDHNDSIYYQEQKILRGFKKKKKFAKAIRSSDDPVTARVSSSRKTHARPPSAWHRCRADVRSNESKVVLEITRPTLRKSLRRKRSQRDSMPMRDLGGGGEEFCVSSFLLCHASLSL